MEKILIVEDDNAYCNFLKQLVEKRGYEVDAVESPITGIEYLAKNEYDLIISDLKMPDMDGIRFIKTAKTMQSNVKTMILTANPDEHSEITSIDNQVDLYLVKEKGIEVLLKYIRLVLDRETSYNNDEILRSRSNEIEVNKKTHQVYKSGTLIALTGKEYRLLELLLENKNEILSRERIIEEIWMLPAIEVEPRVVDVHIKNLRDKLHIFSIVTIRGYGYKWHE